MNILAIGAHPDDIEIGAGGTLARLIKSGSKLSMVCLTSGEQGAFQNDSLGATRELEAKKAAGILGASDIIFLRQPDGFLRETEELKIKLIKLIRELQPDFVFTHSTSESVSDHKVCCEVVANAVDAASGPWFPAAGRSIWQVKAQFGFEVWNPMPSPQLIVNIDEYMTVKMAALRAHESQVKDIDYLKGVEGLAAYRASFSKGRGFAEAFEIKKMTEGVIFS